MIKKLLLDRHHFACRGDVWIADGEYEIRTSEIEKIGPVFVADKPWERCHLNWLTVTEDNGKFRMWYEAFSNPADDFGCRLCYAESDDLLRWEKPNLGICEFEGSKDNNIVIDNSLTHGMGFHGHSIYIDPNSPPYARYRCVFLGALLRPEDMSKQGLVSFAYSPDGIHWTHGAPEIPTDYNHMPVTAFGSDTQSCVRWDTEKRKYIGYFRNLERNGCRSIARGESSDGVHWSEPVTVLRPDMYDNLNADYYNSAATKVTDGGDTAHYIFYSFFNHSTETLDIRLATSRDGINFDRYSRVPFVPNGENCDRGAMYAAAGIHNLPDGRQCIIYSASNHRHCDPAAPNEKSGCYMLAAFERDRLQGLYVKKHFEFTVNGYVDPSCPEVTVNADIRGKICGGLIDDNGDFVPGFSPDDCIPLKGNSTEHVMKWKGTAAQESKVWLKLYIDDADIWSVTVNGDR